MWCSHYRYLHNINLLTCGVLTQFCSRVFSAMMSTWSPWLHPGFDDDLSCLELFLNYYYVYTFYYYEHHSVIDDYSCNPHTIIIHVPFTLTDCNILECSRNVLKTNYLAYYIRNLYIKQNYLTMSTYSCEGKADDGCVRPLTMKLIDCDLSMNLII